MSSSGGAESATVGDTVTLSVADPGLTVSEPEPAAARSLQSRRAIAAHAETVPLAQASRNSPHIPSAPAMVVAVLTAIGREIDRFLNNGMPAVAPRQIVVSHTGTAVFGTIDATDPDGDRLVYRIVEQPKYGSVVVDANGSWIYTPDEDLFSAGGECGPTACFDAYDDSFAIAVTDRGLNLRKLLAYFTGAPTSVTAPVSVEVPTAYTGGGSSTVRTIVFHNATGGTLEFQGMRRQYFADTSTAPPTWVLQPGTFQTFELTPIWLDNGPNPSIDASYRSPDGLKTYRVTLTLHRNNQVSVSCDATGGGVCNAGVDTFVLMDQPGAAASLRGRSNSVLSL